MRKISFLISISIALIITGTTPYSSLAQQSPISGFTQISINPYIVDDLPISIDADDAVKAREQAFEKALQTSFIIILERLYPDDQTRTQIKIPGTQDLGKMLQDFTTRDEKVGAKQYAATFQLRFRPGRVQKYLQTIGVGPSATVASISQNAQNQPSTPTSQTATPRTTPSYTTHTASPIISAEPVIILPFLQTNQGQVLWAGPNPLRDALTSYATATQTGSIIIPTGDIGDNQIINEKSGIKSSPQGFQSLMSKYQSNRAVIVIAVPDSLNGSESATKMTLMFYGSSIANPTPFYLDSIVASVDDVTQNAGLFTQAAQLISSQIPSLTSRITMDEPETELNAQSISAPIDGLAQTLSPITTTPIATSAQTTFSTQTTLPNNTLIVSSGMNETKNTDLDKPQQELSNTLLPEQGLSILARFNTMTEWNDIRTRLKSIPGITSIQIHKLKAQEATILIPPLAMTPSALNAAMTARGLNLSQNDVMVFDYNGNAPAFIVTRISPLQPPSSSPSDLSVTSTPIDQSRTSVDGR